MFLLRDRWVRLLWAFAGGRLAALGIAVSFGVLVVVGSGLIVVVSALIVVAVGSSLIVVVGSLIVVGSGFLGLCVAVAIRGLVFRPRR